MTITVRLFARARDLAGTDIVTLDVPSAATVADVRRALTETHPTLESLSSHLLASIGTDYVTDDTPLTAGSEIALFPPVSGG